MNIGKDEGTLVVKSHKEYGTAVGYSKKSTKKYFTKTKEDKKKSPLLNLNKAPSISPWIYVGLNNQDRPTFVQNYVLSYLKITLEDLQSKRGKKELVLKKKIFCYAMREYSKLKLEYIGSLLKTTHANVLIHIRDVKDKLDIKDLEFTRYVEELNEKLL